MHKQSFFTENKTNVIHFVLADRTLTHTRCIAGLLPPSPALKSSFYGECYEGCAARGQPYMSLSCYCVREGDILFHYKK